MVQPRRKGTDKIEDPKKRGTTFSKRCSGLLKKGVELNKLTGAQVAVIVFSTKGKLRSVGEPSVVKEIIHRYLSQEGNVMPPTSQRELEDWAKKEYDSCATREDLASLIRKHEFVRDYLRKMSKDLENNPSANAGAGDDSGVGVDRSSKVSNDDKIVDRDSFSTLLVDSAAGAGSSGVGPVRSDPEGYVYDDEEIYGELEDFIDLRNFSV